MSEREDKKVDVCVTWGVPARAGVDGGRDSFEADGWAGL